MKQNTFKSSQKRLKPKKNFFLIWQKNLLVIPQGFCVPRSTPKNCERGFIYKKNS